MTFVIARPIYVLTNGGRTVPEIDGNAQSLPRGHNQVGMKSPTLRRTKMNTMNASLFMDKIGQVLVNAALLAALPTAMIAILVQAF